VKNLKLILLKKTEGKAEINGTIPTKANPRFMTEEEIKELENKHPELAQENKNQSKSSEKTSQAAKNQRKKLVYKRENFNRPKKSMILDENMEKNSVKEKERDDDSKKPWKKRISEKEEDEQENEEEDETDDEEEENEEAAEEEENGLNKDKDEQRERNSKHEDGKVENF